MMGSEIFIIVVFTWSENSTPSFFASAICVAKKARNALRLRAEASMISPAFSGTFGFSTVTAPSVPTSSMRALVAAAMVAPTSEP